MLILLPTSKTCYQEVDGLIHDQAAIVANDQEKDDYIKALGLRILRFTNKEVQESPKAVIQRIAAAVSKTPFQKWKGVDSRIPEAQ
ncbi:MAG: DUF559 domain-containing protein [Patescibacteria group bacterium]